MTFVLQEREEEENEKEEEEEEKEEAGYDRPDLSLQSDTHPSSKKTK